MNFFYLCIIALLCGNSLAAQTFTSTVNQSIPDDNTVVTFDIEVSGLPDKIDTIFGLELGCVNITHTYNEDLQVLLRSPDGETVQLFGGVGGGEDNFTNTCVSGEGVPFSTGVAPYSGTFLSFGILGKINNGQNPNGIWTLVVYDTYAFADEGSLIDWSISFSTNPAVPIIYTSSNLPIVKLTTLGMPIENDIKVPVLMQIIDNGANVRNYVAQTNYVFEGKIMAEWQGYTGPFYPKKNYAFEVVDNSGIELDTSILGMPKEHDWIFKAEYLDQTLIKNTISYEMARRMGGYAPRTRPCEIVLDGDYIGVYMLTELVKRDANRINIAKLTTDDISGVDLTGGYIIEMNINDNPSDWTSPNLPSNYTNGGLMVEFKHVYPKIEKIQPQQRDYIRAYVDSFENALLAPNFKDIDAGYRDFIDVSTFIDFLIVNEFSVNYDSYGRSTYLYKEKDTDGGKLKSGPPWDYDRALDYYQPNTTNGWVWEIGHGFWPFPFWWSRMWEDDAYRQQLACRWTTLRQNTLSTDAFMQLIDSTTISLEESQQRNFRIWNSLGNLPYSGHIDSLKSYLTRRLNWIDATLAPELADAEFSSQQVGNNDAVVVFAPNNSFGISYLWDFGDGNNSTQVNPTHTYTSNGTYIASLNIVDAGGCSQTTQNAIQVGSVATINLDLLEGVVFPNPFREAIKINLSAASVHSFTVTLENELGQNCLSKEFDSGTQSCTISTVDILSGTYFLRIKTEERVWGIKIIKI